MLKLKTIHMCAIKRYQIYAYFFQLKKKQIRSECRKLLPFACVSALGKIQNKNIVFKTLKLCLFQNYRKKSENSFFILLNQLGLKFVKYECSTNVFFTKGLFLIRSLLVKITFEINVANNWPNLHT